MPYRYNDYKDWPGHTRDCDCERCLQEYGDHFEAVLLMDRLAASDPERQGAKPATDREWQEFLDAEFPKAMQ